MRPKILTVPQMIDLIIRLLIEKLHDTKQDEVNRTIVTLKDLKANLDEDYINPKKYGTYKEE